MSEQKRKDTRSDREAELAGDNAAVSPSGQDREPRHQTSRGEFLKWGTVALSGIYVGPKITTFAVEKSLGHAGSVGPSPSPYPTAPVYPSQQPYLPATGGAAGLTTAQREALKHQKP